MALPPSLPQLPQWAAQAGGRAGRQGDRLLGTSGDGSRTALPTLVARFGDSVASRVSLSLSLSMRVFFSSSMKTFGSWWMFPFLRFAEETKTSGMKRSIPSFQMPMTSSKHRKMIL
jgi:hypothetical protein